MKSKSLIFLFALIFMIVVSLSVVSADDMQSIDSGEVSGDVDVVTVNPWSTSGELNYDIPADAKEIKSANVYVNVYAGSAKNTHGANANVTLNTSNGEKQLASEQLWIEDGSTDGTIYTVNNHTDKCYSDYQMRYDITDSLKGLNGSSITLKVDTFQMDNKTFDGRIKLIALILAYDDGDSDKISYFVDSTQKWTKTNITTTFENANVSDIIKAELFNVALSTADGSFKVNGELLGDAENHSSGNYYQYNCWDVTSKVITGQNTEFLSINSGTSTYASLKNVLSVLKLQSNKTSADVVESVYSGEVSGDVDVVTVNPWSTSGELNYEVPADAKEIKSAIVYVNVYAGSAKNTHGANADVILNTSNGEKQLASEQLWIEDGSTDATIYVVNDHTDKCYSDYQMRYDITDALKGLNGSSITIKVNTSKMDNKTFDGRIKLIALILAYDDGDSDKISYFVDSTQKWTKSNITTTFENANVSDIIKADLFNIALSSADGSFKVNGELLGDADNHSSGNYYQYNYWDVTSNVIDGQSTEFLSMNLGTSTYASLKNVLSVLKLQSEKISADVSLATEYTSVNTCYAGTNNTITIKVNSNKTGKYVIELLADGNVVNSSEIDLDGENQTAILLTDPTVRPVDETTVNGANNTKVEYAVNVKFNDKVIASANKTVPVLYNGNLGKDLAYNATYIEDSTSITVNGGLVISTLSDTSYLGSKALNRKDIWNIDLDEGSTLVKAMIYVPYNWFNPGLATEDINMFNVTFNSQSITPSAFYRDQGNLGGYGKYGYGLLIYDVTDLAVKGENSLILNKTAETPAVYPSTLIYLFNQTESKTLTTVYFADGADLMSNSNNNAGRISQTTSQFTIDSSDLLEANYIVLAAGAQKGEGNIIFNGNAYEDVWSATTSNSVESFAIDATDLVKESNNISFVATGSTIVALSQILQVSKAITPSQITDLVVSGKGSLSGVLSDINGKAIADANITYAVNGVKNTTSTNDEGEFTIPTTSDCLIEIYYAGTSTIMPVNASLTLKSIAPMRQTTSIVSQDYTTFAIDADAGEQGNYFKVRLVDAAGNPLVNKTVNIGFNGKVYNETTNESGWAVLQINLKKAGTYTFAIAFLGDEGYNASFAVQKIIVNKKKTTITASAKTFKAAAKTKSYTVTLKTDKGSSLDGKTYLKAGKKVTITVNSKTYTAKTNANGKATFKLKITKKGKFTATVKFAGDNTYAAKSKSVKITIK